MKKEFVKLVEIFLKKQPSAFLKDFLLTFFVFFLSVLLSFKCLAEKQIVSEVNYFGSIRASEANVRSGPGGNYPIKFSFRYRSMPVKVVSEYDNWNEIEDFSGERGWISQSLISKKRSLMVVTKKKFITLYSKNDERSPALLYLENFVLGQYQGCVENWCQMKVENKKGWVKKDEVFGDEDISEQSEEEVIEESESEADQE